MKHNWELGPGYDLDAFRIEGGKMRLYGKGGGSPSPAPSSQTVSQTNIPPELMPYATKVLGYAEDLTDINQNPYQQYQGNRVADFNPLQTQAFSNVAGMTTNAGTGNAMNQTQDAYNRSANAGPYNAQNFGNQYGSGPQFQNMGLGYLAANAPQLNQYQMGQANQVSGNNVNNQNINSAKSNYRPDLDQYQMGPASQVRGNNVNNQNINSAQSNYRPDLDQYQMGPASQVRGNNVNNQNINAAQSSYQADLNDYLMGPASQVRGNNVNNQNINAAQSGYQADLNDYLMGPASQVRSQNFGQQSVQDYMSPYQQNVTDIQKQEAIKDYGRQLPGQNAQASSAGAFGGTRQALVAAEGQRNLQTQLGGIQAAGSQNAYQNAQQQFNADQARRQQAQMSNQQAGLTVGQQNLASQLQTQGLRSGQSLQVAMSNLSNRQQSNVQNAANNLQAQGMNAEQAMRAALANQQAGLTVGQQNLQSQLQTQGLRSGQSLQVAMSNLSNRQQTNVQNAANNLQAQGMNAEQAMRAALANQQAGLTVGQQNLSSKLQTQALGAGQSLQVAMSNLSNQQQANVQNAANNLQAQGMNADQALRAALANQQAGLTTGQANLSSKLQTQGLRAGQDLQVAMSNLSNQQQANVQNAANNLQAQGMNAEQAMRAALANQQAGLTVGQQNLQSQLQTQALGSGQSMQAQLANQGAYGQMQGLGMQQNLSANQQAMQNAAQQAQYGLAGQQAGEASRQFGANYGLQNRQQALAAAGQLGNLGMQQYQQNMGINQAQQLSGAQIQAQEQQKLSQQYQDFLNQQNYPYKQLGFMSDLIRGTPTSGGAATMYQAPPNTFGQVAGLGIAGLSALNKKQGGRIKGYNQGGEVTNLAGGGIAELTNPNFSDPSTELQVNTAAKQVANGQPQPIPLDVLRFLQEKIKDLHTAPPTPGTTTVAEDVAKKVLENIQQQKMQDESPMQQQAPQQAPQQQAPQQQAPQQAPQQEASGPNEDGIGSLPTNITPDSYKGGGIVAFVNGGSTPLERLGVEVPDAPNLTYISTPQDKPAYGSSAGMERAIEAAQRLAKPRELSAITTEREELEKAALARAGINSNIGDDRRKQIEKYQASEKDNKSEALRNYFLNAGLGMAAEASKRGNPVSGIGALLQPLSVGASGAAPGYFAELEKQKARSTGYETELAGLSDARRAEVLFGTRADSATREKELVNARNIEQHAIDQQGKLVAARLGREPKALSDMVTFANSYLIAMREAGDPRKDNKILSDGQSKFLELKASAESRNVAATAAQTGAATGVTKAETDIGEANERSRNNYAVLVKNVEKDFETQAANRRGVLYGQLRDAEDVDEENKKTNKINIKTPGYKPLPTNTSRVLHDKLLKERIDAIEKPVTLVVPTATPKQQPATSPAALNTAGTAQVPGAKPNVVGDKIQRRNDDGTLSIKELKDVGGGKLDWVDVTPNKSAPK